MTGLLSIPLAVTIMTILSGAQFSRTANLTIVNKCNETVWPGIFPSKNLTTRGFKLNPGESSVITAPPGWYGRIWGRTRCNFNIIGTGETNHTCQTGSCGDSINCTDPGESPATIAEFAIGGDGGVDYYDVSLVGGFNLPIAVMPFHGRSGNCSVAGCDRDLRDDCPSDLVAKDDEGGKTIACRSACDVFQTDEYCCKGKYGNPSSCSATNYSSAFKKVCPAAYSYAFDDPTSILTCSALDYVVAFCASRNETVCTYQDDKLICHASVSMKTFPSIWWIVILTLSSVIR